MATKSVVLEVREITLAIELIELGARLQLLEAETSLSRDRLIRLYKELGFTHRRDILFPRLRLTDTPPAR